MKTFGAGLVVLCMLLSSPPVASGMMTTLGDGDLAACSAGSGVSIGISGTALINVGSRWYQDTDTGNRIELENIVWGDGLGGGFSFSTPLGDPVTIDVGTHSGITYVDIHDSTHISPRTFDADLYFCSTYLGSLKVNDIVRTENNMMIGAHGGMNFEHGQNIAIGSALYNYNTTDALAFTGIHFFGTTVVGAPEDTSTWTSYPGTFQIGDIAGGNPAQIDIGTDPSGVTNVQFKLPMSGSIRMTDVTFGGSDFGQLALDGLNVHRLAIQFHP